MARDISPRRIVGRHRQHGSAQHHDRCELERAGWRTTASSISANRPVTWGRMASRSKAHTSGLIWPLVMETVKAYLFTIARNLFLQGRRNRKPLGALDMRAVRQIKAELMEVDANSDGR